MAVFMHGRTWWFEYRRRKPALRVRKSTGIPVFHSWRHTANSRMAEAGVPSSVRQMICGWTNDARTRHYDHATHMRELVDAVGKI